MRKKPSKLEQMRAKSVANMDSMLQTNPVALNYTLRNESVTTLKRIIGEVGKIADLDEEKLARRLSVTTRSPYGRVCALINLLTSVVLWPVDGRDGSGIAEVKDEILGNLGVTEEVFIDLKEAKGFHSFVNDDHEIVQGIAPDLEEYEMLTTLLAQQLEVSVIDFKLTNDKWATAETKAVLRAELDREEAQAELEAFSAASATA